MSSEEASRKLLELGAKVARARVETTVTDLFQVLGMTENVPLLEKAWGVQRRLKDLGLRLVPDLDVGTLDSSRCLDFIARPVVGQEHARKEISRGGGEGEERKVLHSNTTR